MKKVWITSLAQDESRVQTLMSLLQTYGLQPGGHFWLDDLAKMGWAGPREELAPKETVLWLIMGPAASLDQQSVRLGLSLLSLAVQADKGHAFPVLFLVTEGELAVESLPTPLRGLEILPFASPTLGAKISARAGMPAKPLLIDYHLDLHAVPGIGLWFEAGPAKGHAWKGAMFGVAGGEIDSHAVGPLGHLPERAVLNYPSKGLKLQAGETEYTAWAVQNEMDDQSAYFVRVKGTPTAVVFGSFAESDAAEVFTLSLC